MPGRMICFVCGSPGAQTSIRIRQHDREPYFPFLMHHEPPKGARLATTDGVVDSCAVCYMFLTQQWESYERSKTPAVKRLYWLKRSDNGSFTGAEMRIQGEYIAQVMGLQYPPGADDRSSPEPKPSLSDREVSNHSNASAAAMFSHYNDESRKKAHNEPFERNSVLDLSTAKRSSGQGNMDEQTKKPENAVCYICGNTYPHTVYNYLNVFDQGSGEPYFSALERVEPFPGAEYMTRKGQVKGCNHCKNVLFQQWQAFEMSGTPLSMRNFKIGRDPERVERPGENNEKQEPEIKTEKYAANEDSSTYHCYICGNPYIADHVRLLHTSQPKGPMLNSMFFPFVRELKRPSGAEPLRSDGTVIVCIKCFGHLSCQWENLEKQSVHVFHRQYSLKFLDAIQSPRKQTSSPDSEDENIEPLNIHISSASPVITSLNSDPGYSQGLLAIAQTTESSPRPVSRSSSLSVSPVKAFGGYTDSRLSAVTDANAVTSVSFRPVPHPLQKVTEIPNRVCFLCAETCLIYKMKHISSYPSRHEAKRNNSQVEPFFPFLANCNPAQGADSLSDDGTVVVCKLCYYNLLKQWTDYERSSDPADSNRWLRKYTLPNYICYVCGSENERKFMRSIAVKNFDFLHEFKAPGGAMIIDEGERVVVCKTCAYSLMQQFTEYDRMGVPQKLRKFNWIKTQHYGLEDERLNNKGASAISLPPSKAQTPVADGPKVRGDREEEGEDGDSRQEQGGLGSKPPPLNLMSPAGPKQQRNTATVSPLHHVPSPTNGVNSLGGNVALNARSQSGFAAALRKLANQAKDSPDEGVKTTSSSSPRATSTKSGPPPLMYTSTTLTSPPVVTIAPTQSHPSLMASDARPTLERLHSNSSMFESYGGGKHDRPQSSASREEDRSTSRDNHSQSARRMTPHSNPGAGSPLLGREEASGRGFQPYRPGDDLRPPLSSSLALDQAAAAAAAAYSYPAAFMPQHAFPHPAFRFDDPLLLERYRMMQSPYLPYSQGMMPHPGLHPLLTAGARYPPDMFPPHFSPFSQPPGRMSEHRSPSFMSEREEKQRELEREREREREKELAAQRERQKLLEREAEKQRERERLAHREGRGDNLISGRDKHDQGSKYGSIIQGTSKGLGIADRYPRVSSSTQNASARKDERRSSKDEYPFLGNRLPSQKSGTEDAEKRYSLVNPLREGQRSRPRSEDVSGRGNKLHDSGLFRPFDSQQALNGYDLEGERIDNRNSGGKLESPTKHSDSHSRDQKFESRYKDGDSTASSAFQSVSSRGEHNSNSLLHSSVPKQTVISGQSVFSAPLNVPSYSSSFVQSSGSLSKEPIMSTDALRSAHNESQSSCISKLDLEQRRKSDTQMERPQWSDSECDSNSEPDNQERKLLISSGPPLKLDTSPKKIKLFSELGLTTYSQKKDADFEKWRKRRRKMKERSVSPVSVESGPPTPLKTMYSADDLCREPDFKKKCHFLSQNLNLEPLSSDSRKANHMILKAIEEEKSRRFITNIAKSESTDTLNTVDTTNASSDNTRLTVKRKIDNEIDDVFNFSAQEKQNLGPPFSRQLSNSSTSSVGRLGSSQSAENLERLPMYSAGPRVPRPSSLSRSFAQEFHESVLQSTRQKEMLRASGDAGRSLTDLSPQSGSSPRVLPWQPEATDTWQGVEKVMEGYHRHMQAERLERHVLIDRSRHLKSENSRLNTVASQLSQRVEEMLRNKSQLEELRQYNQERIDSIKTSLRKLK